MCNWSASFIENKSVTIEGCRGVDDATFYFTHILKHSALRDEHVHDDHTYVHTSHNAYMAARLNNAFLDTTQLRIPILRFLGK